MIACVCPKCSKPLKVKDDLAGKKVKCPGCGHAVPVPAPTPAPALSGSGKQTPVPLPSPESSDSERATQPPEAGRIATQEEPAQQTIADERAAGQPPPELTDFLAPPQSPGELGRLGPYRVLSVLGAGGMGVVFKAEDPGLQRLVAIKAMLPSLAASAAARGRFEREARTAAQIKHDNIVTIHQVSKDQGIPYLAMEFLSGEPLDERLKREQILSVAEVIRIGKEVALALEAAHEAGMIHRDIKPANVFLESRTPPEGAGPRKSARASGTVPNLAARPRVKILDFGLARAAGKESQLTQQGAIIGTPAFMAPEQAAGKEVDARCDLFSLGCLLYRMCTGDLPFKGTDTISTLLAVATLQPPPPRVKNRKVPPALSDLIEKLLKKHPHERPASARAVFEALDAIPIDGSMEQAATFPSANARANHRKKRAWLLATAAGGALALIAAGVFFFNRGTEVDPRKPPVTRPRGVPADQLKADEVSEEDRLLAGGGDPAKVPPTLVAVLHSSPAQARGRNRFLALQIGISDDGKTLTSLDGRHVATWDLATGKELSRFSELLFPKRLKAELAVDLNSTGDKLVWDGGNGNVAFFDLANPKQGTFLVPAGKGIAAFKAISFSPDSKLFLLIPAPVPSTARLFNAETKQPQGNLSTSVVHQAYDFAPDNSMFATAAKNRIQLNPLPFMKIKGLKPPVLVADGSVSFVRFSPDARELVSVSAPDYHFTLWDLKELKEIHQFGGHSKKIRTVAFNPDGKIIASAGDDNLIKVFDRITQQELHHIPLGPKGMEIHQLTFTPEGTHLAAASNLGRVFLFRLPLPKASKPKLVDETKKETKPAEEKNEALPPEKKAKAASEATLKIKVEAGWTSLAKLHRNGAVGDPRRARDRRRARRVLTDRTRGP